MNIVCPNCDAEYEVNKFENNIIGKSVECSHCGQTWFQYNFSERNSIHSGEKNDLKILALEEYQITEEAVKRTVENPSEDNFVGKVRFRLNESAERLEKTKELNLNDNIQLSDRSTKPNKWTIIGFSTISIICINLTFFYVFNFQIQQQFPIGQKILHKYKLFIDHVFDLIQNFYSQTLQFLY